MNKLIFNWIMPLAFLFLVINPIGGFAESTSSVTSSEIVSSTSMAQTVQNLTDGQKYYRAIHIMAMLLLGFGFLMVFVKKYGRSAITATFLLVSVSIPAYILLVNSGLFGSEKVSEIDSLILAEFAAASLLITAGAVLGRLKMWQYIILGILFIPAYMFNEHIMLSNLLGIIEIGSFVDVGGSIVIHAFGAIFGIGVALSMTTKKEFNTEIEVDFTSDRFSLLGSMVLWIFWPSFCGALVLPSEVVHTAINVILALSGATLITYLFTTWLRGKIDAADIANASLAGGVAIGSVCNTASPAQSMIIGLVAGAISTVGFAILQKKEHKLFKLIDTCGVSNLHGIPGLFGGLAALVVVPNISISSQFMGIGISVLIAIVAGSLTGKIISLTGHRLTPYVDDEEFAE